MLLVNRRTCPPTQQVMSDRKYITAGAIFAGYSFAISLSIRAPSRNRINETSIPRLRVIIQVPISTHRSDQKEEKEERGRRPNRDSSESPSSPVNFSITEVVSLLSSLPFSLSLAGPKGKLFHTTTTTTSSNTENINVPKQRRLLGLLGFH